MFVTHERLSLEPYQTWQYCEVADIEPFQGQSDQIFQFSIIQNRVRIPFFARTERAPGETHDSFSTPLARSASGERERENPSPFPLVLPIEARWKRKEHARENIKRCANENAKTGIFGPDFPSDARHLGPVWPPVWINVISRSRFFRLPFFLFIYLSIYLSLALFHSFFLLLLSFSPSLSPTCSFCPVSSRFAFSYSSYFVFAHRNYNSLFSFYIYIIYIYNIYP